MVQNENVSKMLKTTMLYMTFSLCQGLWTVLFDSQEESP